MYNYFAHVHGTICTIILRMSMGPYVQHLTQTLTFKDFAVRLLLGFINFISQREMEPQSL